MGEWQAAWAARCEGRVASGLGGALGKGEWQAARAARSERASAPATYVRIVRGAAKREPTGVGIAAVSPGVYGSAVGP